MELFKTINPYTQLGIAQVQGLGAVAAVLGNPFSVDLLNDTVYTFVCTNYMDGTPGGVQEMGMKSIIPDVANAYAYNTPLSFNEAQQGLITELLVALNQSGADPDSVKLCLLKAETSVAMSGLNTGLQMPLLMAIAAGLSSLDYWKTEINNNSSPWYSYGYFDPNPAVNTANLPKWVSASVNGILGGFSKIKTLNGSLPDVEPSTLFVGSLFGGIGLAAGKVLYKW